jgi:hypothetical protein
VLIQRVPVFAGILTMAPWLHASDLRPVDLSVYAPEEVVLGMPLEVRGTATAKVTHGFIQPHCAAAQIERDGQWTVHHEKRDSLGCGVPGGYVGGPEHHGPGRTYPFELHVQHQAPSVYGEAKLAFPAPGTYRLRVGYFPGVKPWDACRFREEPAATSNELTVRVVAPTGVDARAIECGVRGTPGL